jgi:prephenate dehydratase
MIEVGYLGPRGTFSQEAVDKYVKNRPGYTTKEFNTISDVISAVQNDVIKEAVTPLKTHWRAL